MSQNVGKVPEEVITDEKGKILNGGDRKDVKLKKGCKGYNDRHIYLTRGHPGHK